MHISRNSGLLYTLLSAAIILGVTVLVIQFAQGSFRKTDQGISRDTGLLSANSYPTGAQVYINDKLTTATDDTVYLEPGSYKVSIKKDGYTDWVKQLELEKTLVTQTNARLFPSAPSLTPLTSSGVSAVSPSPDGQKLLYYTASASAQKKNGWYLLELSDSSLPLPKGPRQILEDSAGYDLAAAEFIWSPDSDQVLVVLPNKEALLKLDQLNDLDQLTDTTFQRKQILADWEKEMYFRERQFLSKFPDEIVAIATQSATNVYFSPDKNKLLYTATASATLDDPLITPPPARNTQPQERQLVPGGIYIYDRKEDRNFRIGTAPSESVFPQKHLLTMSLTSDPLDTTSTQSASYQTLVASTSAQTAKEYATYHSPLYADTWQWYPDSQHIFILTQDGVIIKEFDGTNQTTLFSGPVQDGFVYPWPDGNRLIVFTTLSTINPPNLYAVELK